LAAVLTNHFNPLDSPRPTIPNSKSLQYVNIEDIEARLWQDPFTAISQHKHDADAPKEDCPPPQQTAKTDKKIEDTIKCKHNLSALTGSIIQKSKKSPQITILGVMVPGSSSTEDIEDRRRTRYAVLSGLAVKEYAPEDREHIGYIENLRFEDTNKRLDNMPEKIPFEWFKNDKDNLPVLVLWLDDSAFGSMPTPLQMTNDFVEAIRTTAKKPDLIFKIIGPANSNTLQAMVDELATIHKNNLFINSLIRTYRFELYNAIATGDWPGMNIPPTQNQNWISFPSSVMTMNSMFVSAIHDSLNSGCAITKSAPLCTDSQEPFTLISNKVSIDLQAMNIPSSEGNPNDDYKTILTYLQSLNLPSLFTRTSLTDYQLAEALAKELELRGFEIKKDRSDPKDHKDHIVIISEWDTVFGRLGRNFSLPTGSSSPN
jgi:hypothetical protein